MYAESIMLSTRTSVYEIEYQTAKSAMAGLETYLDLGRILFRY